MDMCPLPQSSCYLTSSCFLQVSISQAFQSHSLCCLPCVAPLAKLCLLSRSHSAGRCSLHPCSLLACCRCVLVIWSPPKWFSLLSPWYLIPWCQHRELCQQAQNLRLGLILLFAHVWCDPSSRVNSPTCAAARVDTADLKSSVLSAQANWFSLWKEWGGGGEV